MVFQSSLPAVVMESEFTLCRWVHKLGEITAQALSPESLEYM